MGKAKGEVMDYAKEVLRKFRAVDRPDRELMDQLRTLPDEVLSELQDEFGRNKTVRDVAAERGEE